MFPETTTMTTLSETTSHFAPCQAKSVPVSIWPFRVKLLDLWEGITPVFLKKHPRSNPNKNGTAKQKQK